jgi:hypothetical protein
MKRLALILVALFALALPAQACNPAFVGNAAFLASPCVTPAFGFSTFNSAFAFNSFATPAFGFNAFAFSTPNVAVVAPGVNVAVAGRTKVRVRGGGVRVKVRTR